MPRDPTDVGGTPIGVLVLEIEDPFRGHRRAEQISAGRVQHALRFAGTAGRIEDEQRMFGVEMHWIAFGGDVLHQVVPPVVAIGNHLDRRAGAAHDDDFLHRRRLIQRRIDRRFEKHFFTASPAGIGGDDHFRLSIVIAVRNRFGAEAAEDDRVDRPDPSAGQHRDRQLRDHRHVQRHAVAGLHSEFLQNIRELANFAMQILISQHARVARFALPDDRSLVLVGAEQMPVEAVVRQIEFATDKPFRVRHRSVEHLVPLLEPVEIRGHVPPEAGGVVFGSRPHLLILLFAADVGLRREVARRREFTGFVENTFNGFGHELLLRQRSKTIGA